MKTNIFLALLVTGAAAFAAETPVTFDRSRIGSGTFEAASVFDVNNDGVLDLFSGGFWYPGPAFDKAVGIGPMKYVDTYYDDFSNYPMDVNGDGFMDVVTGGYWDLILRWRENPKGGPGDWPVHDVAKVGNIERACFYDLDGDGMVEVIPVTKPVHVFKLKRDAQGRGLGEFEQFTIETEGAGGHGFGCGDVNGDGRPDLIFSGGWLENPENTWDVKGWIWHPDFNLGSASVPVLVHDVNDDGMSDLIVGEAHNYGLYWLEQGKDGGKAVWTKHDIEKNRSQFHDLQLHDMDNDGKPELVTGKRFWAHNGHDPGDYDPLGTYYYDMDGVNFSRVTVDYGPSNKASGVGIYFWVEDVDGNGWKDILAPGKEGLYLFLNRGK